MHSRQKLLIVAVCVQLAKYNKQIIHYFKVIMTLVITFPE